MISAERGGPRELQKKMAEEASSYARSAHVAGRNTIVPGPSGPHRVCRRCLARGVDDAGQHRAAADRVKLLRQAQPHARAEAGGHAAGPDRGRGLRAVGGEQGLAMTRCTGRMTGSSRRSTRRGRTLRSRPGQQVEPTSALSMSLDQCRRCAGSRCSELVRRLRRGSPLLGLGP